MKTGRTKEAGYLVVSIRLTFVGLDYKKAAALVYMVG